MQAHGAYPASNPVAIEYMQWDAVAKNFRFHEIRLQDLGPDRRRDVEKDDLRCSKCHSTRNVENRGPTPGTDQISPTRRLVKNKPNWDTYDNWGGLLAFNRDRIYRGSIEAAAFRKLLNLWTWRDRAPMRMIIEQLQLQPGAVETTLSSRPLQHVIRRVKGGATDGTPTFSFDDSARGPLEEPFRGMENYVGYAFDRVPTTTTGDRILWGAPDDFVQLFTPGSGGNVSDSDEGRGVELFDRLSTFNMTRVGDELGAHEWGTGSVRVEPRPIALAIALGCLTIDSSGTLTTEGAWASLGLSVPSVDSAFFDARHDATPLPDLYTDTLRRMNSLPRRKVDIQKLNLDRRGDPYAMDRRPDGTPADPIEGLIQRYGIGTISGDATSPSRLRQEIFQRPLDRPHPDRSEISGDIVDREDSESSTSLYNLQKMTLYRYFLEPLGVSVDKWSMGVRGRSRTYTFADVLNDVNNTDALIAELQASLTSRPVTAAALPAPASCNVALKDAVVATIGPPVGTVRKLPEASQVPTYTDLQRIFNKSCIECHGGLGYPPYANRDPGGAFSVNFSENPSAVSPDGVLTASWRVASRLARGGNESLLIDRVHTRRFDEDCYSGVMPCGGPQLSQSDINTLRRWANGDHTYSEGDPHLRTIDGVNYDFQGAGEYTLFREEGLEVQVRYTPVQTEGPIGPNPHTGLASCASLTTAAALRIGAHRITYQPQSVQQPQPVLRLNGKVISSFGSELALSGGIRLLALPTAGFRVETAGGTVIDVTPSGWAYYGIYFLNVNVQQGRGTEGLVGSIGTGTWLPALPDGTQLGARPSTLDARHHVLYEVFGKAWRVSNATSMFDYDPGTSTASFTLASWPGKPGASCTVVGAPPQIPVRPALKSIPASVAIQYCTKVVDPIRRKNCELDVAATGEPGFANAYVQTEVNQLNRAPLASELLAPADYATTFTTVTFKWKATVDPDGNPVTYRHCVWSIDEGFGVNACEKPHGALSRTVVLTKGKEYNWRVLAEDGRAASVDSRTRRITVK